MGKNRSKNQEKKKKFNLVFDESKRKEFLCGFRKRKLERKKKAQEELQRLLKEEKKRIKLENKEAYKKLVVSSRPIPDFDKLIEEEYEDDNVKVKIVELTADSLEKNDLVIGQNRPKVPVESKQTKVKKSNTEKNVPGMGSDIESEQQSESEVENNEDNLKSKKEIKQILKKQATKKIQKSKVFQMKSKLDRVKNKKKSQQKKAHMNKGDQNKKDKNKKDKSKKKGGRRKH